MKNEIDRDLTEEVLGYVVRNRAVFEGEIMMGLGIWFDQVDENVKTLVESGMIRADVLEEDLPAIITPTKDGIEYLERKFTQLN